jgi:hypothetical protein
MFARVHAKLDKETKVFELREIVKPLLMQETYRIGPLPIETEFIVYN